jgi:predicted methyltransferase
MTSAVRSAMSVVLSHVSVRSLREARKRGDTEAEASLDLGLTTTSVRLDDGGVELPGGDRLPWAAVERIARTETQCFEVADGEIEPIRGFSEELGRVYTLMPTERAPTMLVSGMPMHRIRGTDPVADTERKVAALAPLSGHVLDTATGLGYTAIAAAEKGADVLTIELDPLVLEVASRNPWSAALFGHRRIEQRVGDAVDVVAGLPAASFDRVLHDPPVIALGGDLYGASFYRELWRVLRPGGRLFHYVGNPDSPSGARTTRGVLRRLGDVGFKGIRPRRDAFGVVAVKGGPVAWG